MEEFSTIIFVLFIILSIVGGLIENNKKSPSTRKTPHSPHTPKTARTDKTGQEKSLKEMIDEVLKKDSPQERLEYNQQTFSKEASDNFKGNDLLESLEEIIRDEDDHRNTKIQVLMAEEEKNNHEQFKVENLRQAVLVSEVLGKPKALQ